MENKQVIVDKLLCMACLCVGRSLYQLTDQKMQLFYLETLNQIPLCNVPQVCPSVCWECIAMLRKAVAFREQIKDSYRILQTYTSENLHECLLTDITRPPRFRVRTIDPVSIPPASGPDEKVAQGLMEVEVPSVDAKPSIDVQLVYVKEENVDWCKDADDAFLNDRPPSVNSENIEDIENDINKIITKNMKKTRKKETQNKDKEKRAKKIVKRLIKNNKVTKHQKGDEKRQQILTVELSYEEMLLERERESTRDSYVRSQYKCDTCLIGFNYSKSYDTHMSTKHSPNLGEYSCPICKTVIATVDSFTSHYKRHMRRYQCSICHKRTMDLKVMHQHFYSKHEISIKEYKCDVCGKVSSSIDSHRYHKATHKARVQCPQCDKTFSHRAGLMNHRRAAHQPQTPHSCTECGHSFRWKTSLNRHLQNHHSKEKQWAPAAVCSPCDISFSSVSSYQRHLRNSLKHVTQHQLRYICDHCGRRFADKTKIRDHIEEIHLHRTYQCHICLKPSKNRVGLDQHIRNVHKGRPNDKMCHHCGKGFPTKVQLESHIRTHTGERPFICEFCPTTFSQQSNLYKHNRQVHLNIKSKKYPMTKKRKDNAEPTTDNQQCIKPLLNYSPDRGYII